MEPEPEPNAGGFALVLTNRHLLDVNIFLQHDGHHLPICANGLSDLRFEFSDALH
jgi:hypothetical protein